jgi:hypothetical protein
VLAVVLLPAAAAVVVGASVAVVDSAALRPHLLAQCLQLNRQQPRGWLHLSTGIETTVRAFNLKFWNCW